MPLSGSSRRLSPRGQVTLRCDFEDPHVDLATRPTQANGRRLAALACWRGTSGLVAKISDGETLRQFVVRARRVAAHSLVRDPVHLRHLAEGAITMNLDLAGRATVTRSLPLDEEAFESLVARIRPLTVAREPIHYAKVIAAIDQMGGAAIDEKDRESLDNLTRAWKTVADIQGTQVQGYAVQQARIDGSEATAMVSDTQMAAGWLYADLVHADPTGPKADSLAFSLRERYAAAVRIFARMAELTVSTLRLVEALRSAGVLVVDSAAWEEPVVVDVSELTEEARVFAAPAGAELPDMRASLALPDGWTPVSITSLLRQDPASHVRVLLHDAGGSLIASYEAAVARREKDGTSGAWDVLVEDCVLFRFSFDLRNLDAIDGHNLGFEVYDSTNVLKLASTRFMLRMYRASVVAFEVGGHEFVRLKPTSDITDERRRELEIVAQTLEDIVAIERILGCEVEPCAGPLTTRDLLRLRQTRLMLEGNVVDGPGAPIRATTAHGRPPQVVVARASTLDVGGALIPVPQVFARHPHMTVTEIGAAPDAGPEAKIFEVMPPEGERFRMWIPERAEVSDDSDLVEAIPLGLGAEGELSG